MGCTQAKIQHQLHCPVRRIKLRIKSTLNIQLLVEAEFVEDGRSLGTVFFGRGSYFKRPNEGHPILKLRRTGMFQRSVRVIEADGRVSGKIRVLELKGDHVLALQVGPAETAVCVNAIPAAASAEEFAPSSPPRQMAAPAWSVGGESDAVQSEAAVESEQGSAEVINCQGFAVGLQDTLTVVAEEERDNPEAWRFTLLLQRCAAFIYEGEFPRHGRGAARPRASDFDESQLRAIFIPDTKRYFPEGVLYVDARFFPRETYDVCHSTNSLTLAAADTHLPAVVSLDDGNGSGTLLSTGGAATAAVAAAAEGSDVASAAALAAPAAAQAAVVARAADNRATILERILCMLLEAMREKNQRDRA